ncbi:MAG: sigma-70 family RNA polymerase sigma factor [Chitinophagaceae bacterium]|nr:sigma-70 family RNA polymerase sigma factor [Oligoflexus sp.]
MVERKSISKDENWARLMTLAQAGDTRAYERLLRDIAVYVKNAVRRKVVDPAQVDDLAQDILLAIHRARHTYDSSRPFLPWLHAIVRFRLTDQLRRIYRGKRFEELDLNRDYHETYSEPRTNEDLDASLLQALDHLPEKQKKVVELLKLQGLSVKEAARETGMSESALKVSAHRAYKAMRLMLSRPGGSDAG